METSLIPERPIGASLRQISTKSLPILFDINVSKLDLYIRHPRERFAELLEIEDIPGPNTPDACPGLGTPLGRLPHGEW
jgi:hypothetical protein